MSCYLSKALLSAAFVATQGASSLPAQCDDLPWADPATHMPGSNGTQQAAFSWHVHYLHTTSDQETDVAAFQAGFCKEFAKYGADGSSIQSCGWGPNYLGNGEKHICGSCSALEESFSFPHSCGNGTCGESARGPWSVCQNEFFVAQEYIDEVTAWISKPENYRSIGVMRHPNTGCQWGDHKIRAEFFGTVKPEMCLWDLPCNDPGYGCYDGMCGTIPATHDHQHASGCVLEANSSIVV